MPEINFLVQGSTAEPYEVTFLKTDTGLSALCTCQAGQSGQHCKHRSNIIRGVDKGILDINADNLKTVQSWLSDSKLAKAQSRVDAAEAAVKAAQEAAEKAAAKKEAATAKRALARAMNG